MIAHTKRKSHTETLNVTLKSMKDGRQKGVEPSINTNKSVHYKANPVKF